MRRRIALSVLVAALAGLALGALITSNGITCEEWQDEYARVAEQGRGGVLSFVNDGPAAERLRELEHERPDDCPTPEP